MAQYHVPGKEPRYRLIVGWDASLGSFFAQVEDWAWETDGRVVDEDASIGDSPDEGLVGWVGVVTPIVDVQELIDAVAPYGTIPENILQRIRQDQRANIRPKFAHVPPEMMRAAGKRYLAKQKQRQSELDLLSEYQQVTEAQELFVARRYDEALAILEKVLVNNPQFAASWGKRLRVGRAILLTRWSIALLWPLYILLPGPWLIGLTYWCIGFVDPIEDVSYFSFRLKLIPEKLRGRVLSVCRLFPSTSGAAGLFFTGLFLQWFGAVPTLFGQGLILLLGVQAITFQRQFWQIDHQRPSV